MQRMFFSFWGWNIFLVFDAIKISPVKIFVQWVSLKRPHTELLDRLSAFREWGWKSENIALDVIDPFKGKQLGTAINEIPFRALKVSGFVFLFWVPTKIYFFFLSEMKSEGSMKDFWPQNVEKIA